MKGGIEMNNHSNTLIKVMYLISIVGIIINPFNLAVVYAQTNYDVSENLENAILAEQWNRVIQWLRFVDSSTESPVLRMVKGHAYLVKNLNNDSLCYFLSVTSNRDLKKWGEWTGEFLAKNNDNVIAHYFRGDALARIEKWEEALAAFKGFDHPQICNARGVTYAALKQWDNALVELTKATFLKDNFADAHASLGAMWILRRDGIKGSAESYDKAIDISDRFSLAYNGKGCLEYVMGHWNAANDNYRKANSYSTCQNPNLTILITRNSSVVTIATKRAQFPFFSKGDFKDWICVRKRIMKRDSLLYKQFEKVKLPEEINDDIVSVFNKLIDMSELYDQNSIKIEKLLHRNNSKREIREFNNLVTVTNDIRRSDFNKLSSEEKDQIRKLNRWILELVLEECIIHIAMLESPGFSLDRGITEFGVQALSKSNMGSSSLQAGIDRMNDIYRPLADISAAIPIVGPAISQSWNRHLSNQIELNRNLLDWKDQSWSKSGGADFEMKKKAIIEKGDWGVGTWFGLGYHVEPKK